MSNNNNHPLGKAPWLHVIISTGLGAGFVPVAPGTAGAFVALILWYIGYLLIDTTTLFWVTLAAIIVVTLVGVWTSDVMEKYWGQTHEQLLLTNMSVHGYHYSWRLVVDIHGF